MKLTILDSSAINPGDLDYTPLSELGELEIFDDSTQEEVLERTKSTDAVFTNRCRITREIIDASERLKYIGIFATGYNLIDVDYAKKKGITVCNVPSYSTESVAQHVFALLFAICSQTHMYSRDVHDGWWGKLGAKAMFTYPMEEIYGKTMGLVGFGNIARATARIAHSFGMKILVYSRTRYPEYESESLRFTSLSNLLRTSDVVSIHIPYNNDTKGLLDRDKLSVMKKDAIIINTARGGIIDESALANMLNNGRLCGAGLDVFETEPIRDKNPLLSCKYAILTPHIAWSTRQSRARLLDGVVANLKAYLDGNAVNVV